MQFFTTAILLAAASLSTAQSVPASAPGCVKYCLRIAREQAPSACTWAGWCNAYGFQDSVSNCYRNTCGTTNQQVGAQIYQQICSSAGTNTACPSSTGGAASSAVSSVSSVAASASSSVASEASSVTATTDFVTTAYGGVSTTLPASEASSIAASLSSSSGQASSSSQAASSSAAASASSAASTATAPVSSVISSILSSASVIASSASAGASQTPNAAVAVGAPSHAQFVSISALLLGAAAGALML